MTRVRLSRRDRTPPRSKTSTVAAVTALVTLLLTPFVAPLATRAGASVTSKGVYYVTHPAYAQTLFTAINRSRASAGIAALRFDTRLTSSAHLHNLRMANADQLTHQAAGES